MTIRLPRALTTVEKFNIEATMYYDRGLPEIARLEKGLTVAERRGNEKSRRELRRGTKPTEDG